MVVDLLMWFLMPQAQDSDRRVAGEDDAMGHVTWMLGRQ